GRARSRGAAPGPGRMREAGDAMSGGAAGTTCIAFRRTERAVLSRSRKMGRSRAGILTRHAWIHPPELSVAFAWDYLDTGGSALGRSAVFEERDQAEAGMGGAGGDLR